MSEEQGRAWLIAGALLAATGVLAGAFGAHALAASLSPKALAAWDTASRYQIVHALALVCLGAQNVLPVRCLKSVAALLFFGTVMFSGSLYLLVLSTQSAWGMVTPLGGLMLVAGWLLLAWCAWRRRG
jgi:uncharacterized membrane protein YgdD (TMEM256/DUF423 family)